MNLSSKADQLTAAMRDVLQEAGYEVKVSIAEDDGKGGMEFDVSTKGCEISIEFIRWAIGQAAEKLKV